MNKAKFIEKWLIAMPTIVHEEFKLDLEILLQQHLITKHVFVDKGAKPEICKSCQKDFGKSMSKKKYCPICNQHYLF